MDILGTDMEMGDSAQVIANEDIYGGMHRLLTQDQVIQVIQVIQAGQSWWRYGIRKMAPWVMSGDCRIPTCPNISMCEAVGRR